MPLAKPVTNLDAATMRWEGRVDSYMGKNPAAPYKPVKRTIDVNFELIKAGFNPVQEAISIFRSDAATVDNKLHIIDTLLAYSASKFKQIAVDTQVTVTHEQVIRQILQGESESAGRIHELSDSNE